MKSQGMPCNTPEQTTASWRLSQEQRHRRRPHRGRGRGGRQAPPSAELRLPRTTAPYCPVKQQWHRSRRRAMTPGPEKAPTVHCPLRMTEAEHTTSLLLSMQQQMYKCGHMATQNTAETTMMAIVVGGNCLLQWPSSEAQDGLIQSPPWQRTPRYPEQLRDRQGVRHKSRQRL